MVSSRNLKELCLKYRYRSNKDDFVEDFFNPCLERAVLYKRAAGFFSSSSLKSIQRGLIPLLINGGRLELIVSPVLSDKDIAAIKRGEGLKNVVDDSVLLQLDSLEWDDEIETLSWLIATGVLDMRFACSDTGGMYHEKMGIIEDCEGNFVSFNGTLNESHTAHSLNFESFNVEVSWKDDRGIAEMIREEVHSLWTNNTNGLEVFDISEAIKHKILSKRKHSTLADYIASLTNSSQKVSVIENHLPKLYDHQREAVDAWVENDYAGIWKMCTGAGKTITAMQAIVDLQDKLTALDNEKRINVVIVSCPKKTLVDQWENNFREYLPTLPILKAYDNFEDYAGSFKRFLLNRDDDRPRVIISTFATSFHQKFISQVARAGKRKQNILFIVDEMHGAGSANCIKQLNKIDEFIGYRIGLSATPEIEGNDKGSSFLNDFFGGIVKEFDLKDAIDKQILCPYYYYPIPIFLSDDKSKEYSEILISIDDDKTNMSLYDKKRNFLKNPDIYSDTVEELLQTLDKDVSHTLVFCPPGKNDKDDDQRILANVKKLFERAGLCCGSVTAKTTNRVEVLERFAEGVYNILLSIGCLDEGMDIPSTHTALMLYSVDRERQFVQRRGRVLRKYPGKEHAVIYDLITLPQGMDISDERKERIFNREMRRYTEFAQMAINTEEADRIISSVYNSI